MPQPAPRAVDRDLKPANIFVLKPEEGRDPSNELVKVVDFGIATVAEDKTEPGRPAPARLTVPGMVLGTAEYMSPEQAQGFKTDHRVDQYALGCIIYEMLTGRVPHEGVTPAATMLKHITDKPVPPSRVRPNLKIPETLDQIVLTAMAVDPAQRFPSMKELEQALTEQLDELRGRPRSTSSLVLPRPSVWSLFLRRRRNLVIGGAAVLVLGVVGLSAALMHRTKPPQPVVAPTGTAKSHAIHWEIQSDPAGAVVVRRADQAVLGQTPWTHTQDLGVGTIEVELRKQGYQPKRLQLDLGTDVNLQSTLTPESTPVEHKERPKRGGKAGSSKAGGGKAGGRKKGTAVRDNKDVRMLR